MKECRRQRSQRSQGKGQALHEDGRLFADFARQRRPVQACGPAKLPRVAGLGAALAGADVAILGQLPKRPLTAAAGQPLPSEDGVGDAAGPVGARRFLRVAVHGPPGHHLAPGVELGPLRARRLGRVEELDAADVVLVACGGLATGAPEAAGEQALDEGAETHLVEWVFSTRVIGGNKWVEDGKERDDDGRSDGDGAIDVYDAQTSYHCQS